VASSWSHRLEQINFEVIALKVLEYLIDNPDAQDTSEGITAWWLPQVDMQYQSSRINDVLRDLAAKEVILEHIQSGSPTYKINPNKRSEISALLRLLKRK
jgi:hypothetical protein